MGGPSLTLARQRTRTLKQTIALFAFHQTGKTQVAAGGQPLLPDGQVYPPVQRETLKEKPESDRHRRATWLSVDDTPGDE